MQKIKQWIKYLIVVLLFLAVILLTIERNTLGIVYLKIFRQSGILSHKNKNGQLEGKYASYLNGKLYLKSYFKNGLSEGWCTWFNTTTEKRDTEIYYRHGVPELENVYYSNGNLDYSVQWKNGRYINSEYHYSDNGILNTYNAFDLSKNPDNGYCYVAYDNTGRFHQLLGNVFSPYIYSICKDSTVALVKNIKNNCLSDLYISVSTPPLLAVKVDVFINKTHYDRLKIEKNCVIIADVFNKPGKYDIEIYGVLKTSYGAIVKSDTLETSLIRE